MSINPTENTPRTAKPLKPRNLRKPLPTEEDCPNFGKSGCRDLHVEADFTYLYRTKEKPIPDEGDGFLVTV